MMLYVLAANVENMSFVGTGAFAGTANSLDNVISGGVGADSIDGAAGNDTIYGGGGADVLRLQAPVRHLARPWGGCR